MWNELQMTDTPHAELSDSIDGLTNEVRLLRESLDELLEVFEWAVQNHHTQVNDGNWTQSSVSKFPEVQAPHSATADPVENELAKSKPPDLLF